MTPITHDRISVRTKLQHKMHLPITSSSLIWSSYSNPAKTPNYEARYSTCIFFQPRTKHSSQCPKHNVRVQKNLFYCHITGSGFLQNIIICLSHYTMSQYMKMTNKMQLCRIIYYCLAALRVSSDIFAHHQEHLNCITASGITHRSV